MIKLSQYDCNKLLCKVLGHKWMSFEYQGERSGVLRLIFVEIGGMPQMIQLRCARSGAWVAVDAIKAKNYLLQNPFFEEAEEEHHNHNVVVVESAE